MIRSERLRDRAAAIPVAALVALSPPLIFAFSHPLQILGLPLLYAYVFLVWLLAIAGGAAVARRLAALDKAAMPPREEAGPPGGS